MGRKGTRLVHIHTHTYNTMMTMGRYAAFLTALLSALFLVFQQQMSSYSNSNNNVFFVAATARFPAASLSNPAIATDGGPRDFTAKARKAWVAATEKSSSVEEVAQLGAGGNYFVHSSCIMQAPGIGGDATMSLVDNDVSKTVLHEFVYHGIKIWVSTSRTCTCTCRTAAATTISSSSSGRS